MSCFILIQVKLNGGRHVIGVLRGFDPFMNIVLDETVENISTSEKHNIGMVVSLYDIITPLLDNFGQSHLPDDLSYIL